MIIVRQRKGVISYHRSIQGRTSRLRGGPIQAVPISLLYTLILLLLFGVSLQAAEDFRERAISGNFNGPEGVVAGPQGELYVAEEGGKGILWRWRGSKSEPFCDVSRLGCGSGDLLGLAVEKEYLYVAAPSLQGGSIIRISLLHPAVAVVFANHLGFTNGLISDGHYLFVSDTRPGFAPGRLFRLPLDRRIQSPASAAETFQAPLRGPNGLALSPDHHTLYAVHSGWLWFSSYIAAYDAGNLKLLDKATLNGQGDGVAWHKGYLYACLQKEGEIVRIDPRHLAKQTTWRLPGGTEGRIHPASDTFLRGPGYCFAVTDVANASAFDYFLRTVLKRSLPWHHHVYVITKDNS